MVAQLVLNAIIMGTVLSLVGLGLALVLSIMNVVNFAHGEFFTIGGFIAYFMFDRLFVEYLGWPLLLAFFVGFFMVFLVGGAFGFLIEKALIRPFRGNLLMGMMATLAIGIALSMSMAAGIGASTYSVQYPISGNLTFFGASMFNIGKSSPNFEKVDLIF